MALLMISLAERHPSWLVFSECSGVHGAADVPRREALSEIVGSSELSVVLWQLDRDTFNAIVKEAAQEQRKHYPALLAKVPLLEAMDA